METSEFIPQEALDMDSVESKIFKVCNRLGENLQALKEKIDSYKFTEIQKQKVLETLETIKFGLVPLLSKSINFTTEQYNQFGDVARKSNYSALDVLGREVVGLSSVVTPLFVTALLDTKNYLESLAK